MGYRGFFRIAFVVLAVGWGLPAAAAIKTITCNGTTSGQLAALLNTALASGTTVEITGICVGDVTIAGYLTLTNHLNSAALISTDGIRGEVDVSGGAVVINGLLLEGYATNTGESANLAVFGPGYVQLQYSKVTAAQGFGIQVSQAGQLSLLASTVTGNGVAKTAGKNSGIDIVQGGIVYDSTTGAATTVSGNGGAGFYVEEGGILKLGNTTISDNGQTEIFGLMGSVNLNKSGVTVTGATTATQPAIELFTGSRATIVGTKVSSPGGGLLVAGGSSATVVGASLSTGALTNPTIEAASASSIALLGGNTITNSGTGGIAIRVDRNANLMQLLTSRFEVGIADAVDKVTGAGQVLEESSMDLGTGLISSAPGITWTGNLTVSENSVIKLSGGVSVSGSLSLTDGGNGLFYLTNGGTNAVSGGVTCPTGGPAPNSHVANPTDVTPNVVIGTVTPDCLNY